MYIITLIKLEMIFILYYSGIVGVMKYYWRTGEDISQFSSSRLLGRVDSSFLFLIPSVRAPAVFAPPRKLPLNNLSGELNCQPGLNLLEPAWGHCQCQGSLARLLPSTVRLCWWSRQEDRRWPEPAGSTDRKGKAGTGQREMWIEQNYMTGKTEREFFYSCFAMVRILLVALLFIIEYLQTTIIVIHIVYVAE